jgi:hypothetical protein
MLAVAPSLLPQRRREAASIGLFALLAAVLLFGHSPLAALDDGHLLGALVVGLGAAAAVALFRASDVPGYGARHQAIATGAALLLILFAGLAWPQERDYEKQRYALDAPDYPTTQHPGAELADGLGAAYDWARGARGESIALGGTTGALFQYGLFGPDSSNRVRYIGERGDRGAFDGVADCREWRTKINEGGYGFVVTTPGYDQDMPARRLPTEFARWTETDPAASVVLREPNVTVFRIDGELDPSGCR